MMIYFIVFSGLASSLIKLGVSADKLDKIYCKDGFYVIIIALICLPLCLKREIKELKIASILLFSGIFIFVIVLIWQLAEEGVYAHPDENYYNVHVSRNLLTAVSVLLVAYSYQANLFSTFKSMASKKNSNYIKSLSCAIGFSSLVYTLVAILAIFLFGHCI